MEKVDSIEDMREIIDLGRKGANETLRRCDESVEYLKDMILKGKLSDNPMKDFTAVCYGAWDDDVTGPYRELERSVGENQGADVLVVVGRSRKREGFFRASSGFMPEPSFYDRNWSLMWGVVSGVLDFDMEERRVVIPVDGYLSMESRGTLTPHPGSLDDMAFGEEEWEKREGFISRKVADIPHQISKKGPLFDAWVGDIFGGGVYLGIMFGDSVREFFSGKEGGREAYDGGKRMLSGN